MTLFKNYYQMCKATDEEIKDFFASTIFEGVFSSEIKSSHTDYYKGHIHSIKINGEPNNVIGNHINVPINAIDIPEGPCTFKCRVKEEIRNSKNQIAFSISPRTLRSKYELYSQENEEELTNENVFELWGVDNCECIGYYHYDTQTNGYIINDLRKTNFDRIPPYLSNNQEISLWLKYPVKGLELDNYYRFTWKLSHKDKNNPYEIYLDNRFPPQTITPRWFIDNLFEDRHSDKSKNFGSAANFLDTLSKQLSAKESTFVYELLQNANDYPVEGQKVDVEFHITDKYLLFLHSGDKFNVRNISGICGINEKEKVANKKTIGYKGIGFKTVFLNNHYVYLRTGEYSFRFDEGESPEKKRGGKIKRQNAPFQILPIWTEHNEVSTEVNSVFDKADKKFQVQIALRPDNKKLLHIGKNCYENLFREVFSDSNIILFIPNINSVRVFINGIEERACFRNNEEWIVGDYEKEIGENLQSLINKTIDKGNSRIPEKYKDFDYTRVSFACKHDGEMIKSVEDALDERRFNVATSRSRSTTLIISDIPLTNMHSISPTVANFLRKCKSLDGININNHNDLVNIQNIIERNDIKSLYPGFEHIVDMLLDNDIQFSHDGDGDLLDNNGIVIATAGLLLKEHKIAIDPVDADSVSVFKSAGYKIIDSSTFNISMLN